MNPLVRDSRAQMHAMLTGGQILFSPRCAEPQPGFPSLIDSFRRAKAKPDGGLDNKGHFPVEPAGIPYSEVVEMFRGIKLFSSGF
jgi:hypothetical protein